jgi:hypothetical protein
VLARFENLTHLDLPESWTLGLGFNGGPGCGNFYDGKDGNIRLRKVIRQGAEATEKGGDIVLANLPYLTGLTIGATEANITRTEDGMINATWPWTGRIDEWLMEEIPDSFGFANLEYDSM